VTQHTLTLDTTLGAADFVAALRDAINAGVPGLAASVDAGRLNLAADAGYAFGFATPYDPNPAQPGDITAVPPAAPGILDAFAGEEDLTYEFEFLSGGEVGTDEIDIAVTVKDAAGTTLRTLSRTVGADYLAGGAIDLDNGVKFALGEGSVNAGDSFSVTCHSQMDSAGVLDALGLNALLGGQGAVGIDVVDRISRDASNLAIAISAARGDNHRALDLMALEHTTVIDGGMTLHDAYRAMITDVANTRNARSVQHDGQVQLAASLENRRDSVSGVDTDEQAITMMESQRLYQAAARYIQTVDTMLEYLFQAL